MSSHTGMRSAYFWRIRSASALRFSNGCSSLNFERIVTDDASADGVVAVRGLLQVVCEMSMKNYDKLQIRVCCRRSQV
jgi:hypothetical protein